MKSIVKGILDGALEAPREFIQPTVSLVKGGLKAYRQAMQAWGTSQDPQRNQVPTT